jgi:uncharacterized membrane protein YphA (DoxX/SURF4 family)
MAAGRNGLPAKTAKENDAMRERNRFELLAWTARFVVGAVFIFASIEKIQNPDAFSQSILNYRIIDSSVGVTLAAMVLPWIELVAGFCLVLGVYTKGSSSILLVLLVVFILAIAQGLIRGLDISCGCFTQDPAGTRIGVVRLVEDVLLAALAGFAFRFPPSETDRSRPAGSVT